MTPVAVFYVTRSLFVVATLKTDCSSPVLLFVAFRFTFFALGGLAAFAPIKSLALNVSARQIAYYGSSPSPLNAAGRMTLFEFAFYSSASLSLASVASRCLKLNSSCSLMCFLISSSCLRRSKHSWLERVLKRVLTSDYSLASKALSSSSRLK